MTTPIREFSLPSEDVEYLNSLDLGWETVCEDKSRWLLIHRVKLPEGYKQQFATVALRIEPAYPDTQIDMVYFSLALKRVDGKSIRKESNQIIGKTLYQRWSRHRSSNNPWRPGVDDVSTHMAQVNYWLEWELEK